MTKQLRAETLFVLILYEKRQLPTLTINKKKPSIN